MWKMVWTLNTAGVMPAGGSAPSATVTPDAQTIRHQASAGKATFNEQRPQLRLVPRRTRLPLSRRDHRLGEPCGPGVAHLQYDGHIVLPRALADRRGAVLADRNRRSARSSEFFNPNQGSQFATAFESARHYRIASNSIESMSRMDTQANFNIVG